MIWDFLLYLLREWPLAVAMLIVYLVGLLAMPPEDLPLLFNRKPDKEGKR